MAKRAPRPSFKFTLRCSDGATLTGDGPCTDRELLAIYLIGCGGSVDSPLTRARLAYLDACQASLDEHKPAVQS